MAAKNATITKEQAKKELLKITAELGRTPTRNEFLKLNNLKGCHKQGLALLFGKNPYNSLLIFSEVKVNKASKSVTQTINCKECNKEVIKVASSLKGSINHFCSSSCSATHNNRLKPKLDRSCICENCQKDFNKTKDQVSNTCSKFCFMELGMKNRLMKDAVKRRGANAYDTIRHNARVYSKHFYPANCMVCKYDKNYEVCHVKDIKDFTGEETIYEVNNKANLVHLCPNCHWEFDHNLLPLEIIHKVQFAAFGR